MELIYDGQITIATGRSRRETAWRNKEVQWSELVERLSTTHRTAETYSEYVTAKKPRQDEIKDIGGFVGGFLAGGRRKASSVMNRQLLTLDIDHGTMAVWEDYLLLYENAACLYSTHKHSPEAPRLRLIIPLDREVAPDEYVAIARRVAGNLGIEAFDHTTFEPSRLMYWPSTAKDGVYTWDHQDGPWLCADDVLASYRDWRDSSEWPVSDRSHDLVHRAIAKQGDPLEKPGIIGAWCRTYSIAEVIDTYLSEIYEPCAVEGRYTYRPGSTAAGLVVYEDKYAFSHHGTDPVSGKLCNAFDLVRLHRYGLKDEDAREGTPGNKLPSYTEMVEFATKQPAVRKLLGAERTSNARGDFAEAITEDEEPASDEWLASMDVDRKGNYHSTINNIMLVLDNDPLLRGRFAMNQFEKREVALRDLPWRKITPTSRYLTDTDDAGVRHYLENVYNITGVQKVKDAMDLCVNRHAFHPVKDYLEAVSWDGQHRLDTLLIDYLGAADTPYTRAVTRKALVAAVTRIFRPGTKFDYVLTLVGKQGIGKSTILRMLGRQWYSDSFGTVQGKEAFESIQGVWIVEMGELAGLKKAEVETVKHFISKLEDRYRVAYGRRVESFPRQCVFFGTSNNRDFLRDPTGNRRFWPVDTLEHEPVLDLFKDFTNHEIGQVWAEAVAAYKAGEPLYLTAEMEAAAAAVQTEHAEVDERMGLIQRYLDTLLPDNWEDMNVYDRRAFLGGDELGGPGTRVRMRVCIAEIWCEVLGGHQKEMNRFNTKELHDIMRRVEGWEPMESRPRFGAYGTQKGYKRVENSAVFDSKNEKLHAQ